MKKKLGFIVLLTSFAWAQEATIPFVTNDITHFYEAYDQVLQTTDSLKRIQLVNALYLNKGSEGLKAMKEARNYKDYEFVEAMLSYPKFWNALRNKVQEVDKSKLQLENYIARLKEYYPQLKPSTVYFPVGVFRSAGTYRENKILLGAEFFLVDATTPLDELPPNIQAGISQNLPFNLPVTVLHEWVHTQQKPWENKSIIHLSVAEGVAEFIATLVSQTPVSKPVFFGKQNPAKVLNQYMIEIFRDDDVWNWLWNENHNSLQQRDLAYYIGYEMSERYYNKADDKKKAIQELIELDYNNPIQFAQWVDSTGFLPLTVKEIGDKYESLRPTIKRIKEFKNGSPKVSPKLKSLTIEFSEPMSQCCRNLDTDTTAGVQQLPIKSFKGWSKNNTLFTIELQDLKPNTTYGLTLLNFVKEDGGNPLAPYTIRFKTKSKP
jgi:hypothetical protein